MTLVIQHPKYVDPLTVNIINVLLSQAHHLLQTNAYSVFVFNLIACKRHRHNNVRTQKCHSNTCWQESNYTELLVLLLTSL